MKICVINGSPREDYSVTLQTALYLQKRFPAHEFEFVKVGRQSSVKKPDISDALSKMEKADMLLFSYPVYTFSAPSQLCAFIEALSERSERLASKYATQITTSKHFYDVTAHKYVEENLRDMGMRVIRGLSADMDDLLSARGRRDAEEFFRYALACAENGWCEPYTAQANVEKRAGRVTALVADIREDDEKLKALIDVFIAEYPYDVKLINIREYPFKGGCLGCFKCATDGKCVYNDGFDTFLRDSIQSADATVYAFTVKNHSMGARFKMYDDRQFCNGHRTVTEGKPCAYIVNGDIENENNLIQIIEARGEVGRNFIAGIGNDPNGVRLMSARLRYAVENSYSPPRNFYGVGGMKIFRDLIWLMRGLMKADHDFYKKHGIYDFPQKQRGKMLKMCFLGRLMRSKAVRAKMGGKLNEGMISPYKKAISREIKQTER